MSDTVLKTQFDCGSVTILDGTSPTPLEVVAQFDRGDFATTGLTFEQRDTAAYQTRGQVRSLRKTSVNFPTLSFSMMLAEFSDVTAGTVLDMVLGTGEFADRTRTTRIPGDVVTLDVVFRVEGALGTQVLEFRDVHLVADVAEGDPNTVTLNGVVYGSVIEDGQEAADSPWRMVTLDDLGDAIGAAGWTIEASGDPALPLKVTAPADVDGVVVLPVNLDGLVPTSTWRVYAQLIEAADADSWTQTVIAVGTYDPDGEVVSGSMQTAVAAGVAVAGTEAAPAYQTGGLGANGLPTTSLPPPWISADGIARADVQAYGFSTGGVAQRRVAAAHLVREDGSGEATTGGNATGSYHQAASSGTAVGTGDAPCVAMCQGAAEPANDRVIHVAIYVLRPESSAPSRA